MTEPDNKLKASSFIDINFLQKFQDFFAKTMGVASISVDNEGPITKPSNFSDFCIKYTRGSKLGYQRCNQCDIQWGRLASQRGEPVIYKCHTGLTDFAVPIMIEGQHVASILGGQVLTEPPNEEHFRKIARELGINEDEYIEAVKKIKVIPEERVKTAAEFMFFIANSISSISHKNFELFKKNEREVLLRTITEKIRSSLDADEVFELICNELLKIFNTQRTFIVEYKKVTGVPQIDIRKEGKTSPDIRGVSDKNFDIRTAEYWGETLFEKGKNIVIDNIAESDTPDYFRETYEILNAKSIMGVPIKKGDDYWGWVGVCQYDKLRHWSEDELSLLETISSQIYIAIKQAELYSTTKKQAEREALLSEITEKIRSSLDIEEVLTFICEETARLFNVQRVAIAVFPDLENFEEYIMRKEYTTSPEIKTHIQVENFQKSASYFGETLFKKNKMVAIDNIETSDAPEDFKKIYSTLGVKSITGAAIKKGENIWGTLVLAEYNEYRHWSEDELSLLEIIASQVYIAINQAEMYEKQQKQVQTESLLRNISEKIRRSLDIEETLSFITEETAKLFKVERTTIAMFTNPNNFEEFVVRKEYKSAANIKGYMDAEDFQKATAYFGQYLLKSNSIITIDDTLAADVPVYVVKRYSTLGVKSLMGTAIRKGDAVWGTLTLFEYNINRIWTEEEKTLLKAIAAQVFIAINQAELYKKEQMQAQREKLIGNVIAKAISTFDVNEFKQIVSEVGSFTEADRCYFIEVDLEKMKGNPIESTAEYLSSPDIKSIVGYKFPHEEVEEFIATYLKAKDLVVFDYEQYNNNQSEQHQGIKKYIEVSEMKTGIGIPFFYEDKLNAVLAIEYMKKRKSPSEDELNFLRILANQAGMAYNQILLYQKEKKKAQSERLVRQIIEAVRSSLDIKVVKKNIIEAVCKTFDADRCYFRSYDGTKEQFLPVDYEYLSSQDIKSLVGVEPDQEGLRYFSETMKKQLKGFYPVVADEEVAKNTPLETYLKSADTKADYAIPIVYEEEEIIWLVLHYVKEDPKLNEEAKKMLEAIAYQVDIAFNQIRLYNAEKRTAKREIVLRNIIETMRSSIDINVIKRTVVTEIGKALNTDLCALLIYDQTEEAFFVDEHSEYRSSESEQSLIGYDGRKADVQWFVETFKNASEMNYANVEDFIAKNKLQGAPEESFLRKYNIKSGYNLTINYAGKQLGYIVIMYTQNYRTLNEEELTFLRTIATQAGIALHQATLYKITQMQAEREKISKNLIEILRSTLDKNIIKHLFVKNIGELLKADRVFFAVYDPKANMYLPVDKNSEYLSSPKEKSFVDYDWSTPNNIEYIQPLLEKRELKIPSWDEYIKENPKSQDFISLFEDANVKSSYNFPVIYEDKMMGYFCIEFTKEECKLANEDINRIRNICTQAAIALYHADLYIKAKESTHSKEEFIENISNEFKEPLNFIIEYSEFLAKTEVERHKEIAYLNSINQNGRQLLELTDDIIDISEIESEKFKLYYEHIDSEQLIKTVVNSIQTKADIKDIKIDLITARVNIKADRRMLTKILYILLINSIKFSKRTGKIILKSEFEDDKLIVAIEDTGASMTGASQDEYFTEARQIDTARSSRQKASGLGLSIAKKLVELHSGTIHIETSTERGSRIWFSLPKATPAD